MSDNNVLINKESFEIENNENGFIVDDALTKTISILNKKGYYTEVCKLADIQKPFLIGLLIHELIEEKLLELSEETVEKIKKIIKNADYESTIILFKKNYDFKCLPSGYKLNGRCLQYNLSILKESADIALKTLIELDNENVNSIDLLETWAINLPSIG